MQSPPISQAEIDVRIHNHKPAKKWDVHKDRTPGLRREPADRAFNSVCVTRSGESQNQAP